MRKLGEVFTPFSIPAVIRIFDVFEKSNFEIRVVGGAVRDFLANKSIKDIDFATTAKPEEIIQVLETNDIKYIPTGLQHGTITAHIDGQNFEITTLRIDQTCDGRHAEVSFTNDWQKDAERRDFTFNAMSIDSSSNLYDYFNGQEDLKNGIVRFIGNPEDRIKEDYLRILRYYRFHARYGKEIDEMSENACEKLAPGLKDISGERIYQELMGIFKLKTTISPTIELMAGSGIFKEAFGFTPTVDIPHFFNRINILKNKFGFEFSGKEHLFFLGFLSSEVDQLTHRLKLSNKEYQHIKLVRSMVYEVHPSASIRQIREWVRIFGKDIIKDAIIFHWVKTEELINDLHPFNEFLRMIYVWNIPKFPVTGKDLLHHGLKPGKEFGKVLSDLECVWVKTDYVLTKEELLDII